MHLDLINSYKNKSKKIKKNSVQDAIKSVELVKFIFYKKNMQEFKILLIGCGSIGNRHIESILKIKTKTQIFITIIEKN